MNREYNFLLSGIGTFNKINWNCDTIQVLHLWNWKLYPDIDTNRKYTFNFLGEQWMVNGQQNALAEWNTDRLKLISLLMFGVGQIFLHSVVYSRDLGEENVNRNSSLCLVEDTIRVSPSDACTPLWRSIREVVERRCQGEARCQIVVSSSLLAGGTPPSDLACPDSVRWIICLPHK